MKARNTTQLVTALLIMVYAMTSGVVYAQKVIPDFRIDTFQEKQGSVTLNGEAFFEVTYRVSVNHLGKEAVTPVKWCFVLFDDKGNNIPASGAEYGLLKPYAPRDSREGVVMFRSRSRDIFSMPFVRWSSDECAQSLKKT